MEISRIPASFGVAYETISLMTNRPRRIIALILGDALHVLRYSKSSAHLVFPDGKEQQYYCVCGAGCDHQPSAEVAAVVQAAKAASPAVTHVVIRHGHGELCDLPIKTPWQGRSHIPLPKGYAFAWHNYELDGIDWLPDEKIWRPDPPAQ